MRRLMASLLSFAAAFMARSADVRDFGAVGDGVADDTSAVQRAIDAGGTVTFPAGTYLVRPIYLKSDGGLSLEPGATIKAHPELGKGAHLVCCVGQTNVFLRGGTIDGNVEAFLAPGTHLGAGGRTFRNKPEDCPAQMIWFHESSGIRLTDLVLRNAPKWNVFLHGCDHVIVRGLDIRSRPDVGEDDGLDIDCCRRVTVSDCLVDVGDDGITLRGDVSGLKDPRPCEGVTVANCVIRSAYAHAIRVGVGSGAIRGCLFDNIVMDRTRGGIWVCSKYRRGRGVDIEDVAFRNIHMDAVCGIFVRHDYKFVAPDDPFRGVMRSIRFSNVTGTSRLPVVQVANGKARMENVRFDNCELVCGDAEDAPAGELQFFQFPKPPDPIGTLRAPGVSGRSSDRWMLGCECLDRDYAEFAKYRDYIVPLGIARIRLQAGWGRCEPEKGRFDFAWLDEIVDWARAQGIAVTLDLSYGNRAYEGGGAQGIAGAIPSGEGLVAWDRWIETLATRYRGKVDDYLMWNEPDTARAANGSAAIGAFNVRTAKVLRRVVPEAHLSALQLAAHEPDLLEACLKGMGEGVKLFDSVCWHAYGPNPDAYYAKVGPKREVLKRLAPNLVLRHTEAGCISEWSEKFAMKQIPWTEVSQAKWDMRRMLGDVSRGIRTSVFTICDLRYTGIIGAMNRKGLLKANEAHEVIGVKKAYRAVQNVVALFDRTAEPDASQPFSTSRTDVSLFGWTRGGAPLAVWWERPPDSEPLAKPTDSRTKRTLDLKWQGRPLVDPVWIDPFDGRVFALEKGDVRPDVTGIVYRVPSYDAPLVLTERRTVADLIAK